jgi:hypothetical protein
MYEYITLFAFGEGPRVPSEYARVQAPYIGLYLCREGGLRYRENGAMPIADGPCNQQ